MARKSWSNLFLLMGAINLVLGLTPRNPVRLVDWIAIPCFLTLAIWVRRRMI
jgi:hypothetical protein